MPTPADLLGRSVVGGVPGLVLGTFAYAIDRLRRRPGGLTLRYSTATPGQRRFIERAYARRGYVVDPVTFRLGTPSSLPPSFPGTPPISGGYPYPVPRGETTRGPFRNPWDPYVGLFDILVRGAKRLIGRIPKGVKRAAGRAGRAGRGGVAGTAVLIGGVLWDYLPDWPSGPTDEELVKKRVKAGCKKYADGWICPPGTYGSAPPRDPAALPPPAPTALPGGAPAEPSEPAPVVTTGPIVRTVPKTSWWKKAFEVATPFLPLLALAIPQGGKQRQASVTTNIAIPSGSSAPFFGYRDLTGLNPGSASLPGSGTGSKRCECKPKRKRKPKDRRKVCYRGTYIETPTGLRKRRGKRISCQSSRKKRPS